MDSFIVSSLIVNIALCTTLSWSGLEWTVVTGKYGPGPNNYDANKCND